jgi:hypothetical protein
MTIEFKKKKADYYYVVKDGAVMGSLVMSKDLWTFVYLVVTNCNTIAKDTLIMGEDELEAKEDLIKVLASGINIKEHSGSYDPEVMHLYQRAGSCNLLVFEQLATDAKELREKINQTIEFKKASDKVCSEIAAKLSAIIQNGPECIDASFQVGIGRDRKWEFADMEGGGITRRNLYDHVLLDYRTNIEKVKKDKGKAIDEFITYTIPKFDTFLSEVNDMIKTYTETSDQKVIVDDDENEEPYDYYAYDDYSEEID